MKAGTASQRAYIENTQQHMKIYYEDSEKNNMYTMTVIIMKELYSLQLQNIVYCPGKLHVTG